MDGEAFLVSGVDLDDAAINIGIGDPAVGGARPAS
jgi:hypothetical protein